MRQMSKKQLPLASKTSDHQYAKELEMISQILDENPTTLEHVAKDISYGRSFFRGREGMTAEQVLRCALLKQIRNCDYRDLAFLLEDSIAMRRFSRIDFGRKISYKTLQRNIKSISPESWEDINKALILYAKKKGIEKGRQVRFDATVTDANIHHPTDSTLLMDCIRVLTRLVFRARDDIGVTLACHDRTRAAKKRLKEIMNGKKEHVRKRKYRKMLKLCEQVVGYAGDAVAKLEEFNTCDFLQGVQAKELAQEIRAYIDAADKVMDQTRRRILEDEKLPPSEKLVSIFEQHTDIIVKKNRETLFGHKIFLAGGKSSLILGCKIVDGNPGDSDIFPDLIDQQLDIYGRYPRQTSADGGFASKDNLETAKSNGIKDVVFSKRRGIPVEQMARSAWVFRKLRDFRAGIEGNISTLKRVCGLDLCNWRGHEGFKSYVHCSIVAFNCLVLARHLLQ